MGNCQPLNGLCGIFIPKLGDCRGCRSYKDLQYPWVNSNHDTDLFFGESVAPQSRGIEGKFRNTL
jgi:hypothetical protein